MLWIDNKIVVVIAKLSNSPSSPDWQTLKIIVPNIVSQVVMEVFFAKLCKIYFFGIIIPSQLFANIIPEHLIANIISNHLIANLHIVVLF